MRCRRCLVTILTLKMSLGITSLDKINDTKDLMNWHTYYQNLKINNWMNIYNCQKTIHIIIWLGSLDYKIIAYNQLLFGHEISWFGY